MIWTFCLGACAAMSALAAQSPVVISIDIAVPGIKVTAAVEPAADNASTSPDWADTATFHIHDRNGDQQVKGGDLSGPWAQAAYKARLQEAVGWHPPYLLVERRCTGNAWACNGVVVFHVHDGVARRMGYLGGESAELNGDDRQIRQGRFRAIYDRFEGGIPGTTHMSHARAPGLIVSLKDSGGDLVVDRRATCRDKANALPTLGEPPGDTSLDADVEPYLARMARTALIQRYCDRKADFKRTLQRAQRTLSERNHRALSAAMDRVTPFEAPYESRKLY